MTNLDGTIDVTVVIKGSKCVQILDRDCQQLPIGTYKVRVMEVLVEESEKNV